MQGKLFIFGIFAIFASLNFKSINAVTFKLTDFVCKSYNQSWVAIHTCRLKVKERYIIAAYYNETIFYPVNDVKIHLQVLKRANGYKPWLINTRIDYCRFMKNPKNPIAKAIFSLFLDFTNFNHSCPFVGLQIIDGFYLRSELIKLPLPTGDYKLAIGWYFYKKLQYDTNMSFTFVENIINQ